MKLFTMIIVLISLSMTCISCRTVGEESGLFTEVYVPPKPPKDVDAAYRMLLNSDRFAIGVVLGEPEGSIEHIAFRLILKSKNRTVLFKSLTEKGGSSAQLYGFSGLFLTDRITYEQLLPTYRERDDLVPVEAGDVGWRIRFGDIVYRKSETVDDDITIVHPRIGQTIAERNREILSGTWSATIDDIVGGGIPFMLAGEDNYPDE